jgi:hypothetical protein
MVPGRLGQSLLPFLRRPPVALSQNSKQGCLEFKKRGGGFRVSLPPQRRPWRTPYAACDWLIQVWYISA